MTLVLQNVTNLQDTVTSANIINSNSSLIQTAVNSTLPLTGGQLLGTVDANSQHILNLPQPLTAFEPLRYTDLNSFVGGGTISNIPAGGLTNQVLTKTSNANYAVAWEAATATAGSGTLTQVSDTNVTLTLGGTPTNALFNAVSITAGWTGTLAAARLNSNVVQSVVNDTNVTGSITSQALTLGWTGTLAYSRMPTIAANSLLGNSTTSTANQAAFTIGSLTLKATPGGTDQIIIADGSTGQLKYTTVAGVAGSNTAGVSSFNTITGAVTSSVVVQTFTTSGTYTPTSGMLHCIIECVGGGGGAGGCGGNNSFLIQGGGGGSGGYSKKYSTAGTVGGSQTVTIGAGGGGGTPGNGGNGGTTSVGTICIATGGLGGVGVVYGSTLGYPGLGASTSGATGDVKTAGSSGVCGTYNVSSSTGDFSLAGQGGPSIFGGQPSQINLSTNGLAGRAPGAGGSGGINNYGDGNSYNGGAGAAGIVIITEYVNL